MKQLILAMLIILGTYADAQAAGQERGGGDVIICKPKSLFLFGIFSGKDVHLADTFSFFQQGGENVLPLVNENLAYSAAIKAFNSRIPGMGSEIHRTVTKLSFEYVSNVEELDDDNIDVSVSGCYKKQLAIQDISTGVVRVNRRLYESMTEGEKALFKIHEALIHIHNAPKDTTPIRAKIRSIAGSNAFYGLLKSSTQKIDRQEVFSRVQAMVKRECQTKHIPTSSDYLYRYGHCTSKDVLRVSINNAYFREFQMTMSYEELSIFASSRTVGDLANFVWKKIPDIYKK